MYSTSESEIRQTYLESAVSTTRANMKQNPVGPACHVRNVLPIVLINQAVDRVLTEGGLRREVREILLAIHCKPISVQIGKENNFGSANSTRRTTQSKHASCMMCKKPDGSVKNGQLK